MNKVIFFISLVFFFSCNENANEKNKNQRKPLNVYLSYLTKSGFKSDQFYKNNTGPWICFKYEKNTVEQKYTGFEYDENYAREFSKHYYFSLVNDTLVVNDLYKLPIVSLVMQVDSLSKWGLKSTFEMYRDGIAFNYNIPNVYNLHSKDYIRYKDYFNKLMERGDTLSYYDTKIEPVSVSIWCFPDLMALSFKGYNYYFKKGNPHKKGIIGIPSDYNNRFIVNRTYTNSTIQEAVYKMIEDFPKGTEGLLAFSDEPNEKGETETWFPEKSGFNYGESTEYIWHNKNNVTVKVSQTHNSTFVFEFVKKGNDVHVKYWNDVVFPFEKGYVSYN